jgi:ubiquinone/menaquinone biosynthesis C-methylase UbiE
MNKDKYKEISELMYDSEAKDMDNSNRENIYVESYRAIKKILELKDEDVVLDVGCGTGKMSIAIGSSVMKYIGIDVSQKALDIANKKREKHQTFIKEDMTNMSFQNDSFTKIVALTSIDQVFERKKALKECNRVLSSDGVMYLEVRNSDYIVKRVFKVFLPLFNYIKITKPIPIDGFKDLNNKEWLDLIDQSGFYVAARSVSIRPLYGVSFVEKFKHILIELCKHLFDSEHQYMLAYVLRSKNG